MLLATMGTANLKMAEDSPTISIIGSAKKEVIDDCHTFGWKTTSRIGGGASIKYPCKIIEFDPLKIRDQSKQVDDQTMMIKDRWGNSIYFFTKDMGEGSKAAEGLACRYVSDASSLRDALIDGRHQAAMAILRTENCRRVSYEYYKSPVIDELRGRQYYLFSRYVGNQKWWSIED